MGIAVVAAFVVVVFLLLVARYAAPRFWWTLGITMTWVLVFAALALSGVLARFDDRPPPYAIMMLAVLVMGVAIGRSQLLAGVPLWLLIAVQSFRLPLELAMHDTSRAGIMPMEMSFSGYNFDILSGISAIAVAIWLRRKDSRLVALVWNSVGCVLLFVIVSVAILASPVIHAFGDGAHVNSFIAHFPYVYLPTICVTAALALHVAVFRRLFAQASSH